MKIVVDTSVFVDHIRADKGPLIELLHLAKSRQARLYVPTVVIAELWRGKSMGVEEIELKAVRMLKGFTVVDLTRQLARHSGKLVREAKINVLEDAIVAATALYLGAELATGNKKHFTKLKELKIFE